jgi:hypothetical protein
VPFSMPSRNAGFSVSDSTQAFIIRFPIVGSFAQDGMSPHRMESAFVACSLTDDDGNCRGNFRGDVKARLVLC